MKLTIQPSGNITGGSFEYEINATTGDIAFTGDIEARIGWGWFSIKKSIPLDGSSHVDPALLNSATVKDGNKYQFGNLTIMVTSIFDQVARCMLVMTGPIRGSGWAEIDLHQPIISLTRVFVSANVPVIGNQTVDARA